MWNQSGVLPFHPTASDLGLQFIEDLAHDWDTTHQAADGGRYDRWVPAKTSATMAHLDRGDIPFHYALADAFTICDQYHCSLQTSTDPNRYYMWTGYTGNDGAGGGPVLDNSELGYSWSTFPERLEAARVSWKIYQDEGIGLDAAGSWGWTDDAYIGNYGDNSLLYFDQYRNAAPGSPLYQKARTGTDVAHGGTFFDILAADVKSGKLPQVSWVVAPEAFCEHPNWPANYGACYDLRADGTVADGQLSVTFASRGGIGAVFHVTSAGDPRSYTVGAGARLAGSWPLAAGQDVRVHGPNGFYRQFTGTGPDLAAAPAGDGLRLTITNPSSSAVRLTVADAYSGKSTGVTVRARAATVVLIGTERGRGWYDVSVTAAGDSGYLRRLAGHVETGRPSISDPAFGNA